MHEDRQDRPESNPLLIGDPNEPLGVERFCAFICGVVIASSARVCGGPVKVDSHKIDDGQIAYRGDYVFMVGSARHPKLADATVLVRKEDTLPGDLRQIGLELDELIRHVAERDRMVDEGFEPATVDLAYVQATRLRGELNERARRIGMPDGTITEFGVAVRYINGPEYTLSLSVMRPHGRAMFRGPDLYLDPDILDDEEALDALSAQVVDVAKQLAVSTPTFTN